MKRYWLALGMMFVVTLLSLAYSTLDIWWAWVAPNPIALEGADASQSPPTGLEVKYIANEGVLIAAGGKQVLIDGLHRQYGIHYSFLPPAQRDQIESAKAPFDNIDLILVSHLHLDHFHPESVGLHLKHNPNTRLVSSEQVVAEVEKNFKDFEAIKARVTAATPALREKVAMKVAGIDFEILGLGHGSERFSAVQNLGHVIKLDGKKFLHIGDADTSTEIFEKFNLDEEGIDIAILPFWFLLDKNGQTVIREHIKPRHIIAVHISPIEAKKITEQIKQVFPEAVAFTTMLEKREY